jgi:hypothetical protein
MMDLLKTSEFKMSFEPIRKKGTNMLIFDLKAFLSADEQDVLLSHNVVSSSNYLFSNSN